MTFFEIFVFFLFVVPAAMVAMYHLFLGGIALGMKRKMHRSRVEKTNFAILIPAHNEEASIEKAINSVKKLDYPGELVSIYIVADNCSDKTAEVAKNTGVKVIIRNDSEHRGKGYALNDTIPQILKETECHGIFIMDADSEIDSHAFRSLDYFVQKKPGVPFQMNSAVASPDDSPLSYFLAIANCLENDFFHSPKAKLKLYVPLRGTGMYLPREILQEFSWKPDSLVEDVCLTLDLLAEEISVNYLPEASVFSEYPSEHRSMAVQRKRWIGGTIALSFIKGFPLFFVGLLTADKLKFDAGLTLLVQSRPMVVFQLLATTFLSLAMIWPLKCGWGIPFLLVTLLCFGAHFAYFMLGVHRLGLTPKRFQMLLLCPVEISKYLLFSMKTMVSGPAKQWERTPRQGEAENEHKKDKH